MAEPTAPAPAKNKANSYHYWHDHGKQRAAVGDVAPMPKPVLVKREETPVGSPITAGQITKYSWSDGAKAVSMYVSPATEEGEFIVEESVEVTCTRTHLTVRCTTVTATGAQRPKQLAFQLAKRVDADKCTHKLKMPAQQIYVRLAKEADGTWYELIGNAKSSEEDEACEND